MSNDRSSSPFDRIADRYDETRGGLRRGRQFAGSVDSFLAKGSVVAELGVGTGLVAGPLAELGHSVVGVDLSPAMLSRAVDRLPHRLLLGDAQQLGLAEDSVDAALAVWVLQLVDDFDAAMGEIARIVRPGGLFINISSKPRVEPNDVTDIVSKMSALLGRGWDHSATLASRLIPYGFVFQTEVATAHDDVKRTPNGQADWIESRSGSMFWDLDPADWDSYVQPAVDALRSLPKPDKARRCTESHLLSLYRLRE